MCFLYSFVRSEINLCLRLLAPTLFNRNTSVSVQIYGSDRYFNLHFTFCVSSWQANTEDEKKNCMWKMFDIFTFVTIQPENLYIIVRLLPSKEYHGKKQKKKKSLHTFLPLTYFIHNPEIVCVISSYIKYTIHHPSPHIEETHTWWRHLKLFLWINEIDFKLQLWFVLGKDNIGNCLCHWRKYCRDNNVMLTGKRW